MAEEQSQGAFLTAVKRKLAVTHPRLTWDGLAKLAGISPRALKTYRMPQGSTEFRAMPPLARGALQELVDAEARSSVGADSTARPAAAVEDSPRESILPQALAALVVRQSRLVLLESRSISGVEWYPGDQLGLRREDRTAMAGVSRVRLKSSLSDVGAEIHELLHHCTRPLGDWLALPSIHTERLSQVVLLDPEELVPTLEAEELARRFTSASTSLEELLFSRLLGELQKSSPTLAATYYTRIREFIVRHPITTLEELRGLASEIPSSIGMLIGQQFYQTVTEGWGQTGVVRLCSHCGNALKESPQGDECRTRACAESLPVREGREIPVENAMRLARGIRQYWQEPGFDEVRLYDDLRASGFSPALYPQMDRVDVEVGEVGMDLKAYVSPELLGARLQRSIGGLSYYPTKWLVIPDRLIRRIPAYLERLKGALKGTKVRALPVSGVLKELQHA